MHLADSFIQAIFHCIQGIHFYQFLHTLGIKPMTFGFASAGLLKI